MIHQIAATLLLMIVFGTLYGALRDRYPKGSLVFKASATCMTVWNCGSGLAAGKQGFSDWMIFVGLLFCVLADVLLELEFLWGVFTFGIAHFCFIAGIYRIEGIQIGSILGILGIYGVFLMIFHKGLPKLGKLKIPVLLYAVVLSSMVSMAVSAAVIVPGRSRYFLAAGACAFLISDSLIAVRTIEKKQSLLMGAVLLILYYGAVYMMGMSVYMH